MNFIKRHVLMDQAVPSVHHMPLFIKTSLGERLTVIAVDPGVPTIEQSHHDVIFVGTTRGRVLKLVNSARNHNDAQPLPVLIEALQVRNDVLLQQFWAGIQFINFVFFLETVLFPSYRIVHG